MQIPFIKKQNDASPKIFSVNTSSCCRENPVAIYSSAMGDGFMVCAACELALLRIAPKQVLDEVIPFSRQRVYLTPATDPWSGNPDTDKYWRYQ